MTIKLLDEFNNEIKNKIKEKKDIIYKHKKNRLGKVNMLEIPEVFEAYGFIFGVVYVVNLLEDSQFVKKAR